MPFLSKRPISLGAPFRANWNDFPSTEEGIVAWWAILMASFGVLTGSNLVLLSAHLLAAASFYLVCRALACHPIFSMAGAILFAMSHYALARGLAHLPLTFYWHVPLGILVSWWCVGREPITGRKELLICFAVAVVHGLQNPYYSGMFAQFLIAAVFYHLFRGRQWRRAALPVFILLVLFVTFLLSNVETFYARLTDGPNPGAVLRSYSDLQLYALRPIELLLPATHRLPALQAWTHDSYFSKALVLGEASSPYLGFVAITGLAALVWRSAYSLANHELAKVPPHFWYLLWILLYSVIGGLNNILGLFGIVLFRGTNRYSIVILALVLLFLVKEMTRFARNRNRWAMWAGATVVTLFGLWEQTTAAPTDAQIAEMRAQVRSDGELVAQIEDRLPAGAMIFQLPVMDYPEVPAIHNMGVYSPFRPYLHSKSLRFSYGSLKGRTRERWQSELGMMETGAQIELLESYGFSAILLNRQAYKDAGRSLLSELAAAGRAEILSDTPELICLALHPSPTPGLPPEFDQNWYGLEGSMGENWRWSSGDATLVLYNTNKVAKSVRVAFGLSTLKPRRVDIFLAGHKISESSLDDPGLRYPTNLEVSLAPGRNTLLFETDGRGEVPGNGDPRKIAFGIHNLKITD